MNVCMHVCMYVCVYKYHVVMYELYLIIFQYLFRSGLDPFVHAAEPSLKLEKNLAQKNITVKYLKDTDKGNLYLLH